MGMKQLTKEERIDVALCVVNGGYSYVKEIYWYLSPDSILAAIAGEEISPHCYNVIRKFVGDVLAIARPL